MARQGKNDERQRPLETLAVLAAACLVFGVIFHARGLIYVALALLVIGLFLKPLAARLSRAWLSLSSGLGVVNSKVLLTLTYYLLLTPLAILYRRGHGDFLNLKPGKGRRSHWIERDHEFAPRDLDRPW